MNKRQADILDLLKSEDGISVRAMALHFNVTPATIRRDLDQLEHQGRLTRLHGSATLSRGGVVEFKFADKARKFAAEKRAIGLAVAKMIQPGMTVSLDTGTTTLEVAREISLVENITVITTSLAIAAALHPQPNLQVVLLGGIVRKSDPDLSGVLTEQNLKLFKVDLAVIGADATSPEGMFTSDLTVARTTQAMMAGAARSVLAMDSGKLRAKALFKYAQWDAVTSVVTDAGVSAEDRKWLSAAVNDVMYVDVTAKG